MISDPPRRDSYTLVGFSDRPRRLSYICKHWMAAVAVIGRDVFLHMYALVGCGRCRSGDWPPQRISYICNHWLAAVASEWPQRVSYICIHRLAAVSESRRCTQPRWSLDQCSTYEYALPPNSRHVVLGQRNVQERTFLTKVYVTTKCLARPPDYSGKFWGRPPKFWIAFGDRATGWPLRSSSEHTVREDLCQVWNEHKRRRYKNQSLALALWLTQRRLNHE